MKMDKEIIGLRAAVPGNNDEQCLYHTEVRMALKAIKQMQGGRKRKVDGGVSALIRLVAGCVPTPRRESTRRDERTEEERNRGERGEESEEAAGTHKVHMCDARKEDESTACYANDSSREAGGGGKKAKGGDSRRRKAGNQEETERGKGGERGG